MTRLRSTCHPRLATLFVVACALCGAQNAAAAKEATILSCGQLLNVKTGELVRDATITVRGDAISSVGPAAIPGARAIDLKNAVCLPGLMDLHAHIMHGNYLEGSSAYKTLMALKRSQEYLRLGFTTLRDPGDIDKYFGLVDLRDAIARGDFQGPNLFVAAHPLTATGGHGDLNDLAPDITEQSFGVIVRGADSAREAVRREVKYGADWIKIFVSGGVMSSHDDPRVQQLTDEELRAAVDEAHRYGKKVAVHAIGTAAIKSSVLAGVDSVEHAILIDDETIQMMKQRGTYLCPTLYVLDYIVDEGPKIGIPEGSIAKGKKLVEERNRNLRKAFSAGLNIVFGSDSIYPTELVPREFLKMTELGLTPLQAIQAATINAARLLGAESRLGSVEVGKEADIIAVPNNPLQDVTALQDVRFVMKSGQVVTNKF